MDQGFSEELKQRQRYWLEHLRAATPRANVERDTCLGLFRVHR